VSPVQVLQELGKARSGEGLQRTRNFGVDGHLYVHFPLYCINNKHDFKGWGENQRIVI